MTLTDLLPFDEAMRSLAGKSLLPTNLSSGELGRISADLKRLATFSAKTDNAIQVQAIADVVDDVVNPRTVIRDGRPVTEGMDQATAILKLKEAARAVGYQPEPDEIGTIKDLSSFKRRSLVVRTNVQMAQGAGQFIQGQDPAVLDAFPAQELVRFEGRKMERDWKDRWAEAGRASGDKDALKAYGKSGRMVALKDSAIWDALGDPDLFPDGLGNPYPPFAFNSGMGVLDVSFDDAEALGLVDINTQVEPQSLEFADPQIPQELRDSNLRSALIDSLGADFEFSPGGILRALTNRDGLTTDGHRWTRIADRQWSIAENAESAKPYHFHRGVFGVLDVIDSLSNN